MDRKFLPCNLEQCYRWNVIRSCFLYLWYDSHPNMYSIYWIYNFKLFLIYLFNKQFIYSSVYY